MSKVGSALIGGGLVVAAGLLIMTIPVLAHFVPQPCDFITSGGFVFEDDPATEGRDNFGAHGGCKQNGPDAPFWGHVNYVDHNGFTPPALNFTAPYHLNSTQITGYLCDPEIPNARDVCGVARTNAGETVRFRVRLVDNGEGTKAICKDEFGIRLDNGYVVSTRRLAAGGPGGGNVQLHKDNPSTVGPEGDESLCNGVESPGEPVQLDCPINPEAQANCGGAPPPPPD
jgi:hypothetical protein